MKKTLVLAALTLMSASAFASKARLSSLQDAAHLSDVQHTFTKPYEAAMHGEWATFEFVTNEGGFVRQMGDSYLGLYLGHAPEAMTSALDNVTIAGMSGSYTKASAFGVVNPLNIFYASKAGDLTWGINFLYLNSDKKNPAAITTAGNEATRKANVMALAGGLTNGAWDASAVLGLAGKAEYAQVNGSTTITGGTLAAGDKAEIALKPTMLLRGGYQMDTLYYYGSYGMGGGKYTVAGTDASDAEKTEIKLGVVNSHKKDGTDFFYGAALNQTTTKDKVGAGSKSESMKLPVIVGVESEAASWLVFRASLTQNVILGSEKSNGGEADSIGPDNKVAGGVGMKWGKFMFDGDLSKGLNADSFGLDGGNFIATASFTYLF